jgi:alkylmercury lyase
MFPAIIGSRAQVESRCPTTDAIIRLTVDPQDGVTDLSPSTAVISIPGDVDVARVRDSCCNPGLFFATSEAAADWLSQHPGGSVLPVANAYAHVHTISSQLLG